MKIYIDVDSVLANIDAVWCLWMRKNLGINIDSENILFWKYPQMLYGSEANRFWELDFIYNFCSPLKGAKQFVDNCIDLVGLKNVALITATPDHLISNKNKWIDMHISKDITIHHTDRKWQYTSDGILIDDRFENVVLHVTENNKPGILFNYNNKYCWVSNFALSAANYGITYLTNYTNILEFLKKEIKNENSG